jgi:hypothetical protein
MSCAGMNEVRTTLFMNLILRSVTDTIVLAVTYTDHDPYKLLQHTVTTS